MTVSPFVDLCCPLDGKTLTISQGSWCCESGHSFDIAKQGYTHLLPVQNKRSRDPGDSKEMVLARERILNAGLYQSIATAVSQMVLAEINNDSHNSKNSSTSVLDAGCGEGYYLRQVAKSCNEKNMNLQLAGLDISKWACLSAAKQDSKPNSTNWLVASNANIPISSNSIDQVLCIFGFPVYQEFSRVLKPNGKLIQVDAGANHLRELREIIYPTLKEDKVDQGLSIDGFKLIQSQNVSFSVNFNDQEKISDLLTMTPHLYRASKEGREKALALQSLDCTVDIKLSCMQCLE